jgi:hypothetical protein
MESFFDAEVWTVARTDKGNAVLIRPAGSELAVPIFIGEYETQAILLGLGGIDVGRPLTHDLSLAILRAMRAELARVDITELKEGTFFARLIITTPAGPVDVDARPSDALALAVRAACPIRIASRVVEEAGVPVSLIADKADSGAEGDEAAEAARRGAAADEERKGLELALSEAITIENYEEAARIRDRLKEIEGLS